MLAVPTQFSLVRAATRVGRFDSFASKKLARAQKIYNPVSDRANLSVRLGKEITDSDTGRPRSRRHRGP